MTVKRTASGALKLLCATTAKTCSVCAYFKSCGFIALERKKNYICLYSRCYPSTWQNCEEVNETVGVEVTHLQNRGPYLLCNTKMGDGASDKQKMKRWSEFRRDDIRK